MKVIKFGGSTLKNAASLEKIKNIVVKEGGKDIIIVVSAFNGITDKLIECVYNALKDTDTHIEVINMHKSILRECGIQENVMDDVFEKFIKAIESIKIYKEVNNRMLDYIMSFGERFAGTIVSSYLNNYGLNTIYVEGHEIGIITDSNFGNAKILPSTYASVSNFLCNVKEIPVVTGFIGKDTEGNYTTLGRNGSDFTAAIISSACGAEYLKIYSDVDGILSGNPLFIKNAKAIDELSLSEYQELEYWLKRIHPHMLSSVVEKNIPLIILNINNSDFSGTKISYKSSAGIPKILIFRDDTFLSIVEVPKNKSYLDVSKSLIDYFVNNNIRPLMFDIRNAQIYFILTSTKKVSDIISKFYNEYTIYTFIDKVAIKIIGENISDNTAIIKKVMDIAGKQKINVTSLSYLSGIHSCIFLIEKKDNYIEFVNELHDNIILR